MKIGIIGVGGIGKFHFRTFLELEQNIVSILGSSKNSSEKTSKELYKKYGIYSKPYSDLREMLKTEDIDIVSICTPPNLHFYLSKKCLEGGKNVFCEKPFTENLEQAKELFILAKKMGKHVTVNTQWAGISKIIAPIPKEIKELKIYMEPGKKNIEMLHDHLSHLNSILISLLGQKEISKINFKEKIPKSTIIEFYYGNCKVKYILKFKDKRPRDILIKVNGVSFKRVVDSDYHQYFLFNNKMKKIEDPLKVSIRSFINNIEKNSKTLVSKEEILKNLEIQEILVKSYCYS